MVANVCYHILEISCYTDLAEGELYIWTENQIHWNTRKK